MNKALRRVGVILAALVVLNLLVPAAAQATDRQTQIEQRRRELREKIRLADARAKTLILGIAESDARKVALEREIASLSEKLAAAERRLGVAEADLSVARADLVIVESDLTRTLGEIDDLNSQQDLRSRWLYTEGGVSFYVNLILSARDFREFFGRLDFIVNVVEEDQRRIDAAGTLADELEQSREVAVQRKDDITTKKSAIESERATIASLRAAVRANRQKVATELALRKSLLAGVQADKAGYLREMSRLEAESRSIASLLRSRQRGQVFQAGSGVRLAWPTTGSVSSGFGYRTHPIFGDRRMHTGIDIRAPSGQAVIASESGTVVFAGTKGGYGLTVIIDHGNALGTLYAHLSALSVGTGARVSRGSRVGSVGCSGYCTGAHLHFETRINGEPRDPMQFF